MPPIGILLMLLVYGATENAWGGRAGLVIQHADGRTVTRCVAFSETSITGLELLRRSGLHVVTTQQAQGTLVCAIDGEGCPSNHCFCDCESGSCFYWSYWHLRADGGGWNYSGTGAGFWTISDGMVDGWSYNGQPPPVLGFGDLCTATPTPLPDTDGDGLPDISEYDAPEPNSQQTHRLLADSDGDGLSDSTEATGPTLPRNRDTDGDLAPDGVEVLVLETDPTAPNSFVDRDRDELPDHADPAPNTPDADADRFLDGYEAAHGVPPGLQPLLADVDEDGFTGNLDALRIQALFLGLVAPSQPIWGGSGKGFSHADCNRDGYITSLDALVIQSFFLGLLGLLPL